MFRYCLLCMLTIVLFFSCSITKNIPEGKYLLDKVDIDIDNKQVGKTEITPFIRQLPNDPKVGLRIYNIVGTDTTNWIKRMIYKIGEPPVIFDPKQTSQSAKEMKAEMQNKGYLNAQIETKIDTVYKKAKINYIITANDPYLIRNYKIKTEDVIIDSILSARKERGRQKLKPGDIFDMSQLEGERTSISRLLRNRGYFVSTVENLHYLADTTLRSNQVDLSLVLKDTNVMKPYYIRNISILSGYDPLNAEAFNIADSVYYKGINVFYDKSRFLNLGVLSGNVMMKSGELYSETRSRRTYDHFSSLGCVSRVNIQYDEIFENDTSKLDCRIYLTPGNMHSIQMGLDGTSKAGDLGIAANIGYTHHNIFNGSEVLGLKLKGAYEFVSASSDDEDDILTHNFYEFGIGVNLGFPKIHIPIIGHLAKQRFNVNTQYGASMDIQDRPEYTRQFFNLSWKNNWINEQKTISQTLNILDVNYVMMPRESESFKKYLANADSLTKYSYEDIFTAGISYNIMYTNANTGNIRQRLYTIRFNAESSGNALYAIFSLSNAKKSDNGQYNILGNPFAQYVKGDIDFSQVFKLDDKTGIAMHTGLGCAFPYKNSSILPFEKRYYAGGSNSIRGWNTRHLGPGSYNGDPNNPATHVGDLKLELSAEYRYKFIKWLEFAYFIDAGNIWTLKGSADQVGGEFDFSTFYKEIAIGTGFGLRFDLSFLILRLDVGKKVYDPAEEEGKRWTFLTKGINKNTTAFYFAIGYPF